MGKDRIEQFQNALNFIGVTGNNSLQAMHLAEIEEEALAALDLLASFVAQARQHNEDAAETAIIDLTISLEHLSHHTQALLPSLEQQLGIAGTEDDLESDTTDLVIA